MFTNFKNIYFSRFFCVLTFINFEQYFTSAALVRYRGNDDDGGACVEQGGVLRLYNESTAAVPRMPEGSDHVHRQTGLPW